MNAADSVVRAVYVRRSRRLILKRAARRDSVVKTARMRATCSLRLYRLGVRRPCVFGRFFFYPRVRRGPRGPDGDRTYRTNGRAFRVKIIVTITDTRRTCGTNQRRVTGPVDSCPLPPPPVGLERNAIAVLGRQDFLPGLGPGPRGTRRRFRSRRLGYYHRSFGGSLERFC